jgi:hypothetical protein
MMVVFVPTFGPNVEASKALIQLARTGTSGDGGEETDIVKASIWRTCLERGAL